MQHLRHPSDRPGVLVDPAAFGIVDPSTDFIGRPGPFGRQRIVSVLPMDGRRLPPQLLVDSAGFYLVDPSDNGLIGEPGVWIPRMLTTGTVLDTRRL